MSNSTDFMLPAVVLIIAGLAFLAIGVRTLFANRHHYDAVSRRTGGTQRAAMGTVGHHPDDETDPLTVHGMVIGNKNGQRVIVRNGKIAEDSISAC